MLYTDNTKKAMRFAYEAHDGQVDKAGLPYIHHPLHIAEQMQDEATTIVALLHDVVEDTDYTLKDIAGMGFGDDVVAALALMTHERSVPYLTYIEKLRHNPISRAVKLADLRHNSDLSRLNNVGRKDLERVEKYKKAMKLLEN